jgi:hypothetical protein
VSAALEAEVRRAMCALIGASDKLRGLGELLEELAGTPGHAAPADLRRAALGIQASAVQAILAAAIAVGVGERLTLVAALREVSEQTERKE